MRSWILGFQIKPSDFGVGCWTFLLRVRYGETGERLPRRSFRRRRVGRFLPGALRRSHFVSNRPEIVKDRFEERLLQERHARRSTRAFFGSDRALNQFDVAIAPFLQSF